MALESIQINKPQLINGKFESPKRTRIISESTGLAKFNIKQKIQEREEASNHFKNSEKKVQNNEELKTIQRNGLNLKSSVSPTRPVRTTISPNVSVLARTSVPKNGNIGMMNDQMMLKLASKQREVLELKHQMDQLKKKLSTSEKELWEIEKQCNRTTASTLPPILSPIYNRQPHSRSSQSSKQAPFLMDPPSLRSKQSLSTIKASIEATATQQTNNFVNLKKKISITQLNSKPSLTNFKNNFQKESNMFWEKSINAFTTLKTDFMKEVHNVQSSSSSSSSDTYVSIEDEEYESDASDYGCADTSDYQLAVK